MNRILVPTDFSQEAENALKVAAQIARKYGSELYVAHMLEMPTALLTQKEETGETLPESIFFMKLARKRFSTLLKKDYLRGITVHEAVESHEAFDGIIESVKRYDCDMIVMGSSGASGLQEVFIGSNTEKVVRNSHVPVLVIKEEIPNFEVKDIAFATDLESKGKEAFISALKFADGIGATMHLVYINTANKFKTSREIDEKMAEFTADAPSDNFTTTVYNDQSIEKGILNFSNSIDAHLMGIATNGRRGLAHLLNGSISEDLVNHAKRPVITFRV